MMKETIRLQDLKKKREDSDLAKFSKLVGTCWKEEDKSEDDMECTYHKLISYSNSDDCPEFKILWLSSDECKTDDYKQLAFGTLIQYNLDCVFGCKKIPASEFNREYRRFLKKANGWNAHQIKL